MVRPSIEEAQEYFKNAKTIRCLFCGLHAHFKYMTSEGIHEYIGGLWINFKDDPERKKNSAKIWDKYSGYAEIISYKNNEPNYEIY